MDAAYQGQHGDFTQDNRGESYATSREHVRGAMLQVRGEYPSGRPDVGFAVSDPAFFRQIGLGAEYQQGANAAAWPVDMNQYAIGKTIEQNIEAYNKRRDERIGVRPEDVILSSATDWNPLVYKPVEWIKAELQRIGIEV